MRPLVALAELHALHRRAGAAAALSPRSSCRSYKGLIFQIRSEGISVSDRRVVKLLKLFAASAIVDGRAGATTATSSS